MSNMYAFHGADAKTGTTMITISSEFSDNVKILKLKIFLATADVTEY